MRRDKRDAGTRGMTVLYYRWVKKLMESGDYHETIDIPDIDIVLAAKGYNILIKNVDRHMKST